MCYLKMNHDTNLPKPFNLRERLPMIKLHCHRRGTADILKCYVLDTSGSISSKSKAK